MNKVADFQVLSDADHIRMRPSMYIGSVSEEPLSGIIGGVYRTVSVVPGLIKIINEILDNSVDEFIRTSGMHANMINVSITNGVMGSSVCIEDNGRGIPIDSIDGEYRPVLAWTRARAGSNFSDDDNRITMGMNGIGAFATNVFSSSFNATTCDGKKTLSVFAQDNATSHKVTVEKSKGRSTFTSIHFTPDLEIFGLAAITEDHLLVIRDRLFNLAATFPGIAFTFNKEKIAYRTPRQFAKQFGEPTILHADKKHLLVIGGSGEDQEFRC